MGKKMNKVQIVAALLLLGLVCFGIFYPYKFLTVLVPLDFSGPTSWQHLYLVDDDVLVPLSGRLLHFALLVPIGLATLIMIGAAVLLVIRLIQGRYFEPNTASALQWVGAGATLSAIFAHIAIGLEAWAVTRFNAENIQPIRFSFDSGEVGLFLMGIGVFLLGWVVRISMIKAQENKEII